MEDELKLINNNLNDALSKLLCNNSNWKYKGNAALQERRQQIAMLIRQHVHHLQQTIVTIRRRRQERMRRRLKQFRSFFMQQMIQMQSNYMEMFVTLRMKHAKLQTEVEDTHSHSENAKVNKALFWENVVPEFTNEEFLNHLHVTRSTFQSLCTQLSTTLSNAPELTCPAMGRIPLDKCVGLSLYFLASGERISIISEKFALPRMRTIKCLKVFCNAVMTSLGKALRQLPQSEADCANVVAGFQRECNMPVALIGVLGVCCIPLHSKGKQGAGNVAPLRMEFLLDDRMLFRELQLTNSKSTLLPMFTQTPNALTMLPARCVNRRLVPSFILAPRNQDYPLRPWLLQRYPDPAAPHEFDFNEVADHLQDLSDCALHRLMSRWRFLSQPLDISFQTAFCIITAATALHNLLEELSEPHLLEWGNNVDVSRFRAKPIESKSDASKEVERAVDIRDFLARTISSTEI